MNRDHEYEENNRIYDSIYPKGGIKCKNYELCKTNLPDWWFSYKKTYICDECDVNFSNDIQTEKGKLEFLNEECPVCFETKRCIIQPKCIHFLCIDCFRRCYYVQENKENEPIFPYPELKDSYFNDPNNTKWDRDYPLIKIYLEEFNEWNNINFDKYLDEYYLHACPICRK